MRMRYTFTLDTDIALIRLIHQSEGVRTKCHWTKCHTEKRRPDKMLKKRTAGQNATGEQTRYRDLLLMLVIVC